MNAGPWIEWGKLKTMRVHPRVNINWIMQSNITKETKQCHVDDTKQQAVAENNGIGMKNMLL